MRIFAFAFSFHLKSCFLAAFSLDLCSGVGKKRELKCDFFLQVSLILWRTKAQAANLSAFGEYGNFCYRRCCSRGMFVIDFKFLGIHLIDCGCLTVEARMGGDVPRFPGISFEINWDLLIYLDSMRKARFHLLARFEDRKHQRKPYFLEISLWFTHNEAHPQFFISQHPSTKSNHCFQTSWIVKQSTSRKSQLNNRERVNRSIANGRHLTISSFIALIINFRVQWMRNEWRNYSFAASFLCSREIYPTLEPLALLFFLNAYLAFYFFAFFQSLMALLCCLLSTFKRNESVSISAHDSVIKIIK